jgi:MinD superfamily P-loop ATPase
VSELSEHFGIPAAACINKVDLNPDVSRQICKYSAEHNIPVIGEIPFDETVPRSINELKPITQYSGSAAAKEIRLMWNELNTLIDAIKPASTTGKEAG